MCRGVNLASWCISASLFALLLVGAGCSSSKPPVAPPIVSKVATRQLPLDPPYDRTSWAVLPEPLPGEIQQRAARMSQKKLLSLNGATLERAATHLGAMFSYRAYCAASISDRTVTIKQRGDIEELAEALAEEASIRVVVDHEARELRLLALSSAAVR